MRPYYVLLVVFSDVFSDVCEGGRKPRLCRGLFYNLQFLHIASSNLVIYPH